MRWHHKFALRLRSLFYKSKLEHELTEELQFHLQRQVEVFLAQGMSSDDARCAALREIGGLEQVKEECRETRRVNLLENLWQDFGFGCRMLLRSPGFAAVVVITLGLGIGANTAIFSVVDAAMLRSLPYRRPDRLVGVWDMSMPKGGVLEFRQRTTTVDLAAYSSDLGYNLTGNGEAVRTTGCMVSGNFFSVLGVSPRIGRFLGPSDEVPGNSRVVVLSNSFWQTRFGGDPNVLGRSIVLEDIPRQVVGVMPASFMFPGRATQFWVPIEFNTADSKSLWGGFLYWSLGRLHDGVTLAQARAEYKAIIPQAAKAYPWPMGDKYGAWSQMDLVQEHSITDVRKTFFLLLGAVALVLLVACANVANLLLVRSVARQKEIAVRSALGANRRRIIAQLITESLVLSLAGGGLGCLVGFVTIGLLKSMMPVSTPGLAAAAIDLRVLAFSAVLSVLTGLVFGFAPAWQASRGDLDQTLRANTAASGTSRKRGRLSASLVVAEVALAVVLVSGAGLLIKSLWHLAQLNTGFRTDHLLTAQVTPSSAYCRGHNNCSDLQRQLVTGVRMLPGVRDASMSDTVPLAALPSTVLAVEDRPEYSVNSPYMAWEFAITPNYLDTMGIPLLRGRNFNEQDDKKGPLVVMVSRYLAQTFWPGEDPIGKRVRPSWQPEWRTVVGVVDDIVKYKALPDSHATWAKTVKGDVYFPAEQGIVGPMYSGTLAVRTGPNIDQEALVRQVSTTLFAISPSIPLSQIQTMDQIVADSVAAPRSLMWLFVVFAALGLSLGVVGIYSVVSYSVAQRTREIGLRMALGARKSDVMKMVLGHGSFLALVGIAIGTAGALSLGRLMASLLHQVRPSDPPTLMLVALFVAAAACSASYFPSRRATRVDPTISLKAE